jgi:hypothetical protein
MVKREKLEAMRWEEEQRASIDVRANQLHDLNTQNEHQISVAEFAHTNAVVKGNIAAASMKGSMKSQKDVIEADYNRRIEEVLSLKENTEKSRHEVKLSAGRNLTILIFRFPVSLLRLRIVSFVS